MIFVIATIEVKPGKREAFLAEFHKNMPNVQAEQGCIEYGPTVDLASGLKAQIPLRENVVTIVEKWESLPALQAHIVAPHMATYRERVKEIVVGSALQILEPK
jgi:quinol monooxygenase YgiN